MYCENEPINRIDPSGYFDVYDFYNVGFVYDPNQDIWYSPQNCWQRWWGYNDFYDQAAEGVINIDTRKVIFNFEGRDWRVQFWKGDYGPTTGGEIGVYYKDENDWVEHYNAVSDSDMLHMSLELYKGNETIFKRVYGEYWWANGFKVDGGTDPSELRLHSLITFHIFDTDEERNYRMRQAFIEAYVQQYGYDGIQFSTNPTDNTISIDW